MSKEIEFEPEPCMVCKRIMVPHPTNNAFYRCKVVTPDPENPNDQTHELLLSTKFLKRVEKNNEKVEVVLKP